MPFTKPVETPSTGKLTPNERRNLRKHVDILSNKSGPKKQNDKLVGRSAPVSRPSDVAKQQVQTPYGATKNGGLKPTTNSRPSSAYSKPPSPWQRDKQADKPPTFQNNKSRPNSGFHQQQRTNSPAGNASAVQQRSNSPAGNASAVAARNRSRTTIGDSTNIPNTKVQSNGSRARSTSSPKPVQAVKPNIKPEQRSNEKLAVSYNSGSSSVAMPQIKETKATLKKDEQVEKVVKKDDKLLAVVPKRSRAHVMPQSSTSKPKKKGHDFHPHELTDWVNWCDACGSIILSLFGKCVQCKKCKMVCHLKCAETVSLTCEADAARGIDPSWYKTIVEETKDEATLKEYNTITRVLPQEEIKEKIEAFNKTVKSTQQMTLQEDGETFRGFIRVTMNLTRPVSVNSDKPASKLQRNDSFYVSKGAVKALYLSSNTTAEEVVSALLNKYGIRDNPLKFALYEKQFREEGHIILRKMMTRERPLFLRLLWGDGNTQQHAFILQENESREIQWESFSVPELNTFLKILEKEQNDHIKCIRTKFDSRRQDMVNAMKHRKKMGLI